MHSPAWYYRRIARMSASEVTHRLQHFALLRMQRAGLFVATNPPSPRARESARWIKAGTEAHRDLYLAAAGRIVDGKSPIFALEEGTGSTELDWNRDPLLGVRAPATFGPLIDLSSETVVGRIRYLWEPNRQLELAVLAQADQLGTDDRYWREIDRRLSTWLDQCPYLLGPNWASALELAIRLINWSVTWQLSALPRWGIGAAGASSELRDRWLSSIYQHVHFITTHYSRFSSANNHLIGEAAGVFIACCTWPFWPEFDQWRDHAYGVLCRETELQNYRDGVNKEQSTAYQAFVLDFLILSGLAGRANGFEFPEAYWRRIETMLEFIASIMDVSGNVPMIGDADDGCVVRLSQEPNFSPYRSLLATGALLFDRPELARRAGILDDKTRQLVDSARWDTLVKHTSDASSMEPSRRSFPEGGYYILGHSFGTEREVRLLVDAGALGYLSIAAHGHADAMAIVLSVGGREFLVDPGTYVYGGRPAWRGYFRSTRAHNTVCVDGLDQSVQGGPFMWTRHATSRCVDFAPGERHEEFSGRHLGYQRLKDPLVHGRRILRDGDRFTVTDQLLCRGSHRIERCWHFAETCTVTVQGNEIHATSGEITIRIRDRADGTTIRSLEGSEQPIGGWISRHFDRKVGATSVFFVNDIAGETTLSAEIDCSHGNTARPGGSAP